tara:strand:+ start:133 stop:771 length:639 start_codon:yes stop_codon:yes gene_type:complete
MTNSIQKLHNAVITLETAINNSFTDNYDTVYKPYLVPFKARLAYAEQQKGVKGKQAMMLSYDIKKGFRDGNGIWLIPEQDISKATKLARYTDKELLELVARIGGNTIGTICKNISLNKTATTKANSKPKTDKPNSAKKSDKPERSHIVSNVYLQAINSGLAKYGSKITNEQLANILIESLKFADKQYENVDAKSVRALLEDQAMLAKLAKSA